jgi:hypothetical protein
MSTSSFSDDYFDVFEEIRNHVKEAVEGAGAQYHTGVLAVEIREQLRTERTELWTEWSDQVALDALKTLIGQLRSQNRQRRSVLHRSAFDVTEEVDASHTQRRIGDMTKSDLKYVARMYKRRARTMNLKAVRIETMINRIPDETTLVRDVFSEEEIAGIFLSANE